MSALWDRREGINLTAEREMVKVTKLRALRLERGLGIRDLEKMTGISRSLIGKMEIKKRRVTRQSQLKITTALGIDADTNLSEIVEVKKDWLYGKGTTLYD